MQKYASLIFALQKFSAGLAGVKPRDNFHCHESENMLKFDSISLRRNKNAKFIFLFSYRFSARKLDSLRHQDELRPFFYLTFAVLIWYNINTMKLERKNIYITKPQSEQLMQYHKQTGLGYSEIFRRALDEYLEGRLKNVPYNSDKSRK